LGGEHGLRVRGDMCRLVVDKLGFTGAVEEEAGFACRTTE
jgi:hypothetical protein